MQLIRDRGVSYAQASANLKVHPTQLRNWVKAFGDDSDPDVDERLWQTSGSVRSTGRYARRHDDARTVHRRRSIKRLNGRLPARAHLPSIHNPTTRS